MKRTILVTGADGQLGRSIRKLAGQYPDCGFVFTDAEQLDITDEQNVMEFLSRSAADVIINCAAYTAVDRAEQEPEAAQKVNTEGPAILARAAAKTGAALVHISTDYVFDGSAGRAYTEQDPTHPLGVYGRTKAGGEREIIASRCRGAIVRTAWLYSEFGHNFVTTMLSLGRQREKVAVVCDQTGSPTYATDLARAIMQLIDRGLDSPARIWHCTGDGQCTWNEFAATIFRMSALKCRAEAITTEQYGAPAPRPACSVLSTQRIRQAGIEPRQWQQALAECLSIIERQSS